MNKGTDQVYDFYRDDPDCDYVSDFGLLCSTELEVRKIDRMIQTALNRCATRIAEIGKKYPQAGIGDTATDEEIAQEFYSLIH